MPTAPARQILRPSFFAGFDAMNRRNAEAVPTRVLGGGSDPFLRDDAWAHRFGRAEVNVLPGVGPPGPPRRPL